MIFGLLPKRHDMNPIIRRFEQILFDTLIKGCN